MELSTLLTQCLKKYCVGQEMEHSQQVLGIQKNTWIIYLEKAVIWKPDK